MSTEPSRPPAEEAGSGACVAWVAIGANLGRRGAALLRVRAALVEGGVAVDAESPQLVTRAVGVTAQPDFLNQVLRLRQATPMSAPRWLDLCREAEGRAGRRPTYRWGPRRADADLLLLGDRGEQRFSGPGLVVPHPELARRPFLCALAAIIDPQLSHPDGWRLAEGAGFFRAWFPGLGSQGLTGLTSVNAQHPGRPPRRSALERRAGGPAG